MEEGDPRVPVAVAVAVAPCLVLLGGAHALSSAGDLADLGFHDLMRGPDQVFADEILAGVLLDESEQCLGVVVRFVGHR